MIFKTHCDNIREIRNIAVSFSEGLRVCTPISMVDRGLSFIFNVCIVLIYNKLKLGMRQTYITSIDLVFSIQSQAL